MQLSRQILELNGNALVCGKARLTVVAVAGILHRRGTPMHPGITMHKIPVKGPVGLLFTVGVLTMILISLPEARWFAALCLPVGVVVGVVLRLTSRD